MTPHQVQRVLLAWRPGHPVGDDPEVREALERVHQDPALQAWYAAHQSFQVSTTAQLRSNRVPTDLAARILASRKVVRPRFRPFGLALALAAAVITAVALWIGFVRNAGELEDFDNFRSRMVKAAVREYRMDVVTNDLAAIRTFLASRQAPSDFDLAPALAALRPVGGGALSWHGHAVSMVCLENANLGMMYLFIVPASAFHAGSPTVPSVGSFSRLATASWVQGDRAYLLAAATAPDQLRPFLPPAPASPRARWGPARSPDLQLVLNDDGLTSRHCRSVH
ncbi:MAG: hypothetical protein JNK85_08045 [Verrucomicrobiales bacterium]|nr:hypothetical protein [Verrucomicrobiales bacterium]